MIFVGKVELDIDMQDVDDSFIDAHELEYNNDDKDIKKAIENEITSWLHDLNIGVNFVNFVKGGRNEWT